MLQVRDRLGIAEECCIEIRPLYRKEPHGTPELARIGLKPTGASRLIVLEGLSGPFTPHMAATLHDPLSEALYGEMAADGSTPFVDVFCRPGVTDAEGETALRALRSTGAGLRRCRAGTRFHFETCVPPGLRSAVERILGNSLIHSFSWSDAGESAVLEPRPGSGVDQAVRRVPLAGLSGEELMHLSRGEGLALDAAEMRAIRDYFVQLDRSPTDVELQSVALAWSEHCSHKTFKATIEFQFAGARDTIHGLLAECIIAPTLALNRPWVRSAFVDNAGVIAFDDNFDLAFKVETHNHPSALEPFGGAHTGVGGVIRDILAVSAVPIANTDVLCFGDVDIPDVDVPARAHHPRNTMHGVVRGIADYGNNMGIPTVGGAVLFHPGYTMNPLVHCGTLGIAPRDSHPTAPQPGDAVMVLGGRTGRDGLHGATMSSEALDRLSVEASTVQIGAPITEKIVRDVVPRLRDERLYHAINDCGAGGLCSAVGEMAEKLGVELDLSLVPLKYEGLRPWEIWLSEAQERMVLAVPPGSVRRVMDICNGHDLDATVLGEFRADGVLRLRYGIELVAELDLSFLYDGCPTRVLEARFNPPRYATSIPEGATEDARYDSALVRLLAHPNIRSKEEIIRQYDHEVQAATVVKPLVGHAGPSDAAVIQPLSSSLRGAVLAHGINPHYGVQDPYDMTTLAVDEALRNLTAVGGSIERAALLDNFCWGEVDSPDGLGGLVRAAQGCRDAAKLYGVPFISGKDSLRNTSVDASGVQSIPGTILISALGVVNDIRQTVTMDLKAAGSLIYILGATSAELGGSHLYLTSGRTGGMIPQVHTETPDLMRRLTGAIEAGLVLSCHDLSEGGLAVAAAEMALAGALGMRIELDRVPGDASDSETLLFSESAGRFLVEVSGELVTEFETAMHGLPCAPIGRTEHAAFVVTHRGTTVIELPLHEIDAAWRTPLTAPPSGPPEPTQIESRRSNTSPSSSGKTWIGTSLHGAARALVLVGPGVNCDVETVEACRQAGADAEAVHLNALLAGTVRLDDFSVFVLPGGFSYGDHLGAGAMLATLLRHRLLDDIERFVADGRPVLGICNGFQVLARLGLLGPVSLVANSTDRFECRWVGLFTQPSPCPFLDGLEDLELPIAHGQGRVVVQDGSLIDVLPLAPLRYDDNPNGSIANIAGICSASGNVFGLMPHPERYVTPYQHPYRRSGPPYGLRLFQNVVRYAVTGL